ncbi:MAG: aminodeoxychorismate synthase component I [Thermodesulfatator sp.]|nr:MAG: aminodeoxychorismate synthase component I [Thermodesulfatator sp.]
MRRFLWINAYRWPEEIFLFESPVETLSLEDGDVERFFSLGEDYLRRGYYLAGFLTYELGYFLEEKLRPRARRPSSWPLALFGVFCEPQRLQGLKPPPKKGFAIRDLTLSLDFEDYRRAIEKIKAYIASGDTYQVNFTLKYLFTFEGSAEGLFWELLRQQRVRYAALAEGEGWAVVSLSPELFLWRRGKLLRTSPMKGTAPRKALPEEDRKVAEWLSRDPKNRAENVMIADLLRNDLGRLSKPGSVWVPELFRVELYRTVHQMISTVEGELPEGITLYEILRALFPCGSVTGAPKIRTMEIIAELEPRSRGIYTGAVGFIEPSGDFLFNVAIRTVEIRGEEGEFGIGSGVVWDSDPEEEWRECLLKARFLTESPPEFDLVETLRFSPGEGLVRLERHLARLARSAAHMVRPFPEAEIRRALIEATRGLSRPSRVRLLLSEWGEVRVETSSLEDFPRPVRVGLTRRPPVPDSLYLFHKTTYRPWYEEARRRASALGLSEIVFYDEAGRLLEGTITNVFLEKDGRLYTPPLALGLLPGVLREELLETGQAEERVLTLADLLSGRLYLGNSARGLTLVEALYFL